MVRIININQAVTNVKEYASIKFEVLENGNLLFSIGYENGKKSQVTFSKTSDQSTCVNKWIENLETKYNLIRL